MYFQIKLPWCNFRFTTLSLISSLNRKTWTFKMNFIAYSLNLKKWYVEA